jgi:hypothetical protein
MRILNDERVKVKGENRALILHYIIGKMFFFEAPFFVAFFPHLLIYIFL